MRQKIGDTDVSKAQVQDETISTYLTDYATAPSPVLKTAYQLCLDLAAKWARYGTTTLDDQQQRAEDIHKHYLALADSIKGEIAASAAPTGSTGGILVGGIGDTRGPLSDQPCDYPGYIAPSRYVF